MNVVEHAKLAESLGYQRVWLYDSPGIYLDVWTCLGMLAVATDRIGLGTAVTVPRLRTPMVEAAAIAAIETAAPGRLAVGWGTGATARWTFAKRAVAMASLEHHMDKVRALLRGETVEYDGGNVQMMHLPGYAPTRPIEVPFLVSALGPKGQELAHKFDGVMTVGFPMGGYDWSAQLVVGTVLDDGEPITSDRAKEAAGPWYVIMVHGAWESDPSAPAGFPGGDEWLAAIDALRPEGERHLAVHEGHATLLTDRDRKLVDAAGEGIAGLAWVADRTGTKAKLDESAAAGATEIIYAPSGPDLERELRVFAEAAGL